ncbi:MAG: type II secretion system minor pseudopilin GspI [Pseudomonadota bacterium]
MTRLKYKQGFTLIEVVVAIAVIAIGLSATIKTISSVGKNTALLNERIVATWVAQNAMANFELGFDPDPEKENSGSEEMAGIEWYWEKSVQETEDPDILRIEFNVRKDNKSSSQVYATLVTLLPTYFDTTNDSSINPPRVIGNL